MPLSDDELLAFDTTKLGGFHTPPRQLLRKHGDAYRGQLVAAKRIEEWADGADEARSSPTSDPNWSDGHVGALRDVVAQLRQGDFLPGGKLYD